MSYSHQQTGAAQRVARRTHRLADESWEPLQGEDGQDEDGDLRGDTAHEFANLNFESPLVARALRGSRVSINAGSAMAALSEGFASLRCEAIYVLAYLHHVPALSLLTEAASADPVVEVRKVAVAALGGFADETVLPVLRGALHDPAGEVRAIAAIVLRRKRSTARGTEAGSVRALHRARGRDLRPPA